jgi:hypothetical protein
MAARRSIDIALANDEKKLALRPLLTIVFGKHSIWDQHITCKHNKRYFDSIWEKGFVKLNKIVNTKIIQELLLPECIEYIRKNGEHSMISLMVR